MVVELSLVFTKAKMNALEHSFLFIELCIFSQSH